MAFGPTVESVARRRPITQVCLASVALFALLSGCATRVRVVPADQTQPALHAAARSASLPWWCDSLDQEIIRRHNLQALLRRNPDRALLELQSVVSRHPDVAAAAALADLNCRYAGTLQRAQPEKALGLYSNSHLAGASSEVIVPAGHRTYENREAIEEVKRILRLHVSELAQRSESGGEY